MKRSAALLLACLLPALAAPGPEGLGRSFQKLRKTGKLNVGYLGGSITAGSGASKPNETSYRALTTKWFQEQYPKAEIKEINAAIGGTGSDLGAFRCQRDLLSGKPDLVFVEFAVNDSSNESRVMRSMEGIVRQIWHANAEADIVFLYTINKNSMAATYDKGELPNTVQWHNKVAAAYRIPTLNMGEAIYRAVKDGKQTWEKVLPDNVHPSDIGYEIYMQQIRPFLASHQKDKKSKPRTKLPKPLSAENFENAHLVDAQDLVAEGWTRDDASVGKRFPHSIATNKPGTELKYKFKGTAIGLFWIIAPDSGDVEWSIDGSKPKRASSWDSYALRFSRNNYVIFNDSLTPGEHELTFRVLAEKNEKSTGTWIRIGSLLVN